MFGIIILGILGGVKSELQITYQHQLSSYLMGLLNQSFKF